MTFLVVGAAGLVGREVVRSLQARRASVRVLSHTARLAGVDNAIGDLADRTSLARALVGVDGACFITPHHPHEEQLGHAFIDACEAAGVRRLVYVSAFHPHTRSLMLQRLLDGVVGLIGPHYKAKLRIERRVRAGRLPPVVLCPSNFYQNDELGLPEIVAGRYPQPLGHALANRVDTRDIGDAVARALVDDVPSGVYPLVGPHGWTGPRCAEVWSNVLGAPVAYAGDSIEGWRATVGARMPAARAADFAKTYRVIQRFGIPASDRSIARTTEVLGRSPRTYLAYVEELAASWRPGGEVVTLGAGVDT